MFSFKERSKSIELSVDDTFDIVIIGGGIVGCSIAAHASQVGLTALLLEKDDLASGASGNSTGLAHAGLRYLAQGHLGYVFKEGHERRRLERLAPHWVKPFEFIFPVFEGDPYRLGVVRFGTLIYDLLAAADAYLSKARLPRSHRSLSISDVTGLVPALSARGLRGALQYFVDSRVLDSRLTLGLAQAAASRGAHIVTYAQVEKVDSESARVTAKDRLGKKMFEVSGRLVINTTGAWADLTQKLSGLPGNLVMPSRGVHLVVNRLADWPLIFSSPDEGRVFFVLPFGRDASLVGTTDREITDQQVEESPTESEITELVQNLFRFFKLSSQFPTEKDYRRTEVRSVYWGSRPLLQQNRSAKKASREHAIIKSNPRFWSVPGVKLTAARAVGEEVTREILSALGKPAVPDIDLGLLPGGEPQGKADAEHLSEQTRIYLRETYGSRAGAISALIRADPILAQPVEEGEYWVSGEIPYLVQEEMVLNLNDLLWRRTKWALQRVLSPEAIARIAALLAQSLGWSPEKRTQEVEAYRREEARHRLPKS